MAYIRNPEILALGMYDRGFIQFGDFTLTDGLWSPILVNLHGVSSFDKSSALSPASQFLIRENVVRAYGELLEDFSYDHVVGVPEGAFTLTGMVAYHARQSALQIRISKKTHGHPVSIEGSHRAGERGILIDDVLTSGKSFREAKETVECDELVAAGGVVLVDREQGGIENLADQGLPVKAAIGITTLLDILAAEQRIGQQQTEFLRGYFAGEITGPTS